MRREETGGGGGRRVVLTKVYHALRDSPAIDIGELWVRRTRFHVPAMQDPSKGADGLAAKRIRKKEKERGREKETEPPWPQKWGGGRRASSLVNASFRAPLRQRKKRQERKRENDESERGRGNKRPRLIERKKTNKRGTRDAGKGAKLLDGEIHRDNLIRGLRCGYGIRAEIRSRAPDRTPSGPL